MTDKGQFSIRGLLLSFPAPAMNLLVTRTTNAHKVWFVILLFTWQEERCGGFPRQRRIAHISGTSLRGKACGRTSCVRCSHFVSAAVIRLLIWSRWIWTSSMTAMSLISLTLASEEFRLMRNTRQNTTDFSGRYLVYRAAGLWVYRGREKRNPNPYTQADADPDASCGYWWVESWPCILQFKTDQFLDKL